jgi:hypothetical protein
MRYQDEFLMPKVLSESTNIIYKMLHPVLLDFRRLRRQVVATHVWSHSLVVSSELDELVFPSIPELRETM